MTDNTPKEPFYNNSAWWRCVGIGEAVVFGGLILLACLRGIVFPLLIGNSIEEHYVYSNYVFPIFISYLIPIFVFQLFLDIHGCAGMVYIFPIFVSLLLWWIFLGVVVGTIIYRVRLLLQKKRGNEKQPD